jgi:hypothetical protein
VNLCWTCMVPDCSEEEDGGPHRTDSDNVTVGEVEEDIDYHRQEHSYQADQLREARIRVYGELWTAVEAAGSPARRSEGGPARVLMNFRIE